MKDWYAADFETTQDDENSTRVWYWGICNINNPEQVDKGIDFDSFMQYVNTSNKIIYFHNIKFDGSYIIDWLFRNNYVWRKKKTKELEPGEFTTLISDKGIWYTVTVCMYPNERGWYSLIEFRDSLKLISLPIEKIPAAFGLEEEKGKIDYNQNRPIGYKPTPQEEEYLNHDVIIMAKALDIMRDKGLIKLTTGSCAMADYKKRITTKKFNQLFPKLPLSVDADIRQSYKGGWTYLNPKYKSVTVGDGRVFDVNSMYPWAMTHCLLPIGEPVHYAGKYPGDLNYPLYVQQLVAEFHIKPGHYPSIQIKNSFMYLDNEYIEHSVEPTLLTLTNVDLDIMFFNYDVTVYEWYGGYMFRGEIGLFDDYINYWYDVKQQADKDGNKGLKQISKLFLNSLYGKFGTRPEGRSKIPYWDDELKLVKYTIGEVEERKAGYIPVATFITSYCRDRINRGAYACGDRFVYADTDSLHIIGLDPVPGLDVDRYRLGAFKEESTFIRGKFLRQKTYLEIFIKGDKEFMDIKCCGMPEKMKNSVTEEQFEIGAVFDHSINESISPKLMPKTVRGGVVLRETTFKIKG